jgi:hypothetical protein
MTAILPVLVFVISAAVLYLRFRRPPRLVPGNTPRSASRWASVSAAPAAAAGPSAGGPADAAGSAGEAEQAESGESGESGE